MTLTSSEATLAWAAARALHPRDFDAAFAEFQRLTEADHVDETK